MAAMVMALFALRQEPQFAVGLFVSLIDMLVLVSLTDMLVLVSLIDMLVLLSLNKLLRAECYDNWQTCHLPQWF